MTTTHRTERLSPTRRGTAQVRLQSALNTLTQQNAYTARDTTVAKLCELAGVSRNSLYRYHRPILMSLREHQRRGPQAAQSRYRKSAEQHRLETFALREQIAKLAALVDHYYAAYRETAILLERRDRELAQLRSKAASRPTPLRP